MAGQADPNANQLCDNLDEITSPCCRFYMFLFPSLVLHGEIAVPMKWNQRVPHHFFVEYPAHGGWKATVQSGIGDVQGATFCLRDGKPQVLLGLNSNVCRLNQVVKSQFLLVAMLV